MNVASASEPDRPDLDQHSAETVDASSMARPRLVILSGKGGVGRSTVAAGLAIAAAARGERVLAVDVTADGGLAAAVASARTGPVDSEENGFGSLEVLALSTEQSLSQYVELYLKLPIAPSRIGPIARIFDYVATAAPGVREILTIGKIAWEVREGPWDAVIVDGPATGHIIELLAAADNLGSVIGRGVLVDQTDWIGELLADPVTTQVVTVVTPEELPTSETLGLIHRIEHETRVAIAGIVVNRVPPMLGPDGDARVVREQAEPGVSDGLRKALGLAMSRSESTETQLVRLAETGLPRCLVGEVVDPVAAVVAAGVAALVGRS